MKQLRPSVAYVVNALNPGGTEKLVVEMSKVFRADYELLVVCLDEPGAWADDLRQAGIPVHVLWRQPGLDLSMIGRLAALFRAAGTSIIHAHQCTPWFYSALARLKFSKPKLLLEEHGRFFPEPDKPLRRLVNRLLIRRLSHRFVAVSEDIRQRLERYEGLDASQVQVIYNGVNAEAPLSPDERLRLRSAMGFKPDAFVVGTVGRFDTIKNLPMLVQGLAAAGDRVPELNGLLVGDGPEFPAIQGEIERLGWSGRVCLTGYRPDARRLVQCMDLFVLSSLSEGTSMALLEALSAGIPVAVTRVGGNPEIVTPEMGWLVESGDVAGLAAAIVDSFANPTKRTQFAAAGRQRFQERFSFRAMIDAYARQYRELLGGAG